RGGAGADRTRRAVLALRAVGAPQAAEAVPLHDTGGALALAGADDVDQRALGEDLDGQLLADLVAARVVGADLGHVPARGDPGLAEVTALRLVHLARVDLPEAQLDRG